MSDTIVVMANGRIEQAGKPFDVYSRPRNPFVAGFLGNVNLMHGNLKQDADGHFVETADGAVFRGQLDQPADLGAPVVAAIRPEAFKIIPGQDAPAGNGGRMVCRGSVRETIFLGDAFVYHIALSHGDQPTSTMITLKTTNDGGERPLADGAPIALSYDMQASRILPAADGQSY